MGKPIWAPIKDHMKRYSTPLLIQFSSVQSLSCVRLFVTPWTAAHQASCSSPTPGVYSNSCPLSRWWHPTISSSVFPFSSCLQSIPASESFPMSQFFASGGQSIGLSVSTSGIPMNIQDWFPLGLTALISLQSKGLSKVFSNTTVQKHQFFKCSAFFMVQLSHPYMTAGKTMGFIIQTFVCRVISLLFNVLFVIIRFVTAFLSRSKRLFISWLQSP